MSVHQMPTHTPPASSGPWSAPRASLPAYPAHSDPRQQTASQDVSDLPLPDHFPEPYTEHQHQRQQPQDYPSSGLPATVPCPAKQSLRTPHAHSDSAKEGVRRITDKYASPALLYVNGGSACSSDHLSSSLSPVETWHASSTPPSSTHHSSAASPTPSSGCSGSPVMNGRHCVGGPDSTPRSCGQSPAGGHHQQSQQGHHNLAPLSISSAFSDASSDMSDASPSPALTVSGRGGGGLGGMGVGSGRYQSVSGIALSTSLGDGVSAEDVQQVEMFYRSHSTEVTVCRSLTNLYFGSQAHNPHHASSGNDDQGRQSPSGDVWEFVTTGIPVLVLDSGDHHRARQLSLVLAEKGTGFVLWKDVVSHLTCYACPAANFHTLRISSDGGNKLAGLSFDDGRAAGEFASALMKLTSDPDDELLMLSQKSKKKKKKKKSQQDSGKKSVKFKPPKKSDISQPCCFQHVTKLERPQITGFTPLPPSGVPPAPGVGGGGGGGGGCEVSSLTDMLHDRLTVGSDRTRSASSELSDFSAEQ